MDSASIPSTVQDKASSLPSDLPQLNTITTNTTNSLQPSVAKETILDQNMSSHINKRWSLFGFTSSASSSIKDGQSTPTKTPEVLEKHGNVYIEPEDVQDAPSSFISSTQEHEPAAITTLSTATDDDLSETILGRSLSLEPTLEANMSDTLTTKNTEYIADPSGPGLVAPAVVGVSELSVLAPTGTTQSMNGEGQATMSSTYSWLSIIPGYGNKTDNISSLQEPSLSGRDQATDAEAEQKDDSGDDANGMEPKVGRSFAQLSEARLSQQNLTAIKISDEVAQEKKQTFAELNEKNSNDKSTLVGKDVGKAAASLSRVILRKKNMVIPNYYDQFPDIHKDLFSWYGQCHHEEPKNPTSPQTPRHERSKSLVMSAVSTLSNLFSRGSTAPSSPVLSNHEGLHRGPKGIRKVVIFGIHGWFPTKLVRTVIGEPTGTSKKFCDEMLAALKDYLNEHGVQLKDEDDVTMIPLEGEGKVLDRVELLYQNFTQNETWTNALHEADLVLVATHSQGTPTSILLMSHLIDEGMLRIQENDPKQQRVGILTMAGISHGPFPFLKGNFVVRWFEAEAAGELFEFMDSDTAIAQKYREALGLVLSSGVRLTCVASLEDQVVPLYSAVMTSVHHPSIVRAVYIDGASYQDDFLTNLIAFALRLRNAGVEDHHVLVHLSEAICGSIYGEGHSTIYEEREVYLLAIRSLLEPPQSLTPEESRSNPTMHPFQAKERLNPFYLPWAMRGVVDEIQARGATELKDELERLKGLYDDWNPVTKALKDIKFRLEPVRSML